MTRADQIAQAKRLYEKFTGHTADECGSVKVPKVPPVGVCIGDIDGVLYTTVRDGKVEKYIHKFRAKDKPLFVVSPDGTQLWLIGGAYDFTERGIIDKSDFKNR
jgi:hypothetical protein